MATNIYHPGSCLGYRDLLMFMMNLASKPGLHNTAHHVAQAVASLVVTQQVSEAFTFVQNFLQEAQIPHSGNTFLRSFVLERSANELILTRFQG
jgi:hypothetical protein